MPQLLKAHSKVSLSALRSMDEQQLLDTRICDLPLSLERPWIKKNMSRLNFELAAKGLRFRPHIWISDDWFSPDGVAGFAIPFFILHTRLIELERKMMGLAEGSTSQWCMKLFRHETGHALDNAFHLRKNKRRQALFGLTSQEYPDSYLPDRKSKDYVQHLEDCYAQSHPDEDWAETFATWLNPRSAWKTRYQNWPALEKLEFINKFFHDRHGQYPVNQNKNEMDSFKTNKITLREYYRIKRLRYGHNKSPRILM